MFEGLLLTYSSKRIGTIRVGLINPDYDNDIILNSLPDIPCSTSGDLDHALPHESLGGRSCLCSPLDNIFLHFSRFLLSVYRSVFADAHTLFPSSPEHWLRNSLLSGTPILKLWMPWVPQTPLSVFPTQEGMAFTSTTGSETASGQ